MRWRSATNSVPLLKTSPLGASSPFSSTFAYNANDLPVSATLNSGPTQAQETVQYDQNSRLTSLQATGPATAAAPLASTYSYGYNALNWTTGLRGIVELELRDFGQVGTAARMLQEPVLA